MKNFKFLTLFAIGLLLMLSACEKEPKSSGGDTPSPERNTDGKIEMSVAALGTDVEKLINKLEKKGWEELDYDKKNETYYYWNGMDELCDILTRDDIVYVTIWNDYYTSFSKALSAFCDYHDVAVDKAKDVYEGGINGRDFSSPSEFKKYLNSVSESDIKYGGAEEVFVNSKKGYYIALEIYYDSREGLWMVEIDVALFDIGG